MSLTQLAKTINETGRRIRAMGTTKLAAQGPKFLMLVAAAVAMVLVVDPLGMSPLVGAVLADSSGDGNLSRSERVDAVVAGLHLDPAVAATNLTGSWGALP